MRDRCVCSQHWGFCSRAPMGACPLRETAKVAELRETVSVANYDRDMTCKACGQYGDGCMCPKREGGSDDR